MMPFIIILLSCTVFVLGEEYIPDEYMYIYGFTAGTVTSLLASVVK